MRRNLFPVTLSASGIDLLLAELKPSELLLALRSAGNEESVTFNGVRIGVEGLRYSLREVDGKEVRYTDLIGDGWRRFFPRTRQAFALVGAWTSIHMPTPSELDAVRSSMSPTLEGAAEVWTVTLPGRADDPDREVVLLEGDLETVGEALRKAEAAQRASSAVGFASTLEALRRSIRTIDGNAVPLAKDSELDAVLSVRDVFLLGAAWDEIHQGGGEVATVGEARSPSGAA